MALKIGIDVGGTFTDFVVTRDDAEPAIYKSLSTPSDPSIAVVNGLTDIAASMNPPLSLEAFAPTIDTIVHGTTVTTNATLTGTGAKCGLLTTEGVRDALEMRRGIREEQYNNRYTNVKPLVPRYLRAGIKGRLDRNGRETAPLDLDSVRKAVDLFKQEGVQAVSICFMNSFAVRTSILTWSCRSSKQWNAIVLAHVSSAVHTKCSWIGRNCSSLRVRWISRSGPSVRLLKYPSVPH